MHVLEGADVGICGLTLWRNPEIQGKSIDLGQVTATLTCLYLISNSGDKQARHQRLVPPTSSETMSRHESNESHREKPVFSVSGLTQSGLYNHRRSQEA